ncbi:MAG TPA: heme ABC exporter ATP-binding protein CcmA [Acidimicrobiales bacterium]|nr:heme ABC exporter ATP-binding protein CcmA [Acidimicrobiales bacterium]
MGPIVRFRSAVSLLGRFPALAGVDLDVASGEVLLVHGPNGAGKTTLLRACAGLVAIGTGEADVLGHDLRRHRRAVRRRVGLLGHAPFLYDELTVEENLRFAARAAGRPVAAADAAMARMGVDGRLRHLTVGRLSTGQKRRAAIAAVVAREPELWLLDEPHAGLDAGGRELLDALVAEVSASGGTVILASHELDRAAALATRQVLMAGGRVTGGLLADAGPAGPADPTTGAATNPGDRREAGVVA